MTSSPTLRAVPLKSQGTSNFFEKLNAQWHKRALQVFMVIVLAHWAEHLAQAVQIYILGWPRPQAGGVLGLWYPWLVTSEVLHYGYALIMLLGIWILRRGFSSVSHRWWTAALVIQFWHHIEHALLIGQATLRHNVFGSPVPVSILQMVVPRVELHLFYNTVVFIPMIAALYYHVFSSARDIGQIQCSCAWRYQAASNNSM